MRSGAAAALHPRWLDTNSAAHSGSGCQDPHMAKRGGSNGDGRRHTKKSSHVGKRCALCRKTLYVQDQVAQLSTGKPAHQECKVAYAARKKRGSTTTWSDQEALAQRQMKAHRDQLLAGETFRGHKPSTWRLGGSPSSTPETR